MLVSKTILHLPIRIRATSPDTNATVRSITNESTQRRLLNQGLSLEDRVCVYKPRVQILDNWGYCNGTNENGEPAKWYNDGSSNLCDRFEDDRMWTYYAGQIVVIPRDQVLE